MSRITVDSGVLPPPEAIDFTERVRRINEERFARTGRAPTAFTHHYGCQQNVSDGEKIDGMLSEMGYAFAADSGEADIVLFNTCAVRENAENRIFGNVGALIHAKRRNPDMIIGLCGCMMQQQHIADKIRQSYPYVDIVFGTHALPRLPELLYRRLADGWRVFETEESAGEIVEDLPLKRDGKVKAWLPVMYGCDNFCTYCVVPFVRGRERSREPERILAEAKELVAEGYKEIMLLGQNVNSYGKTLQKPMSFAELLRQICAIEGDFRVRFMTSHPKDCTRELIDAIADNPKICRLIHLPVQSGSDRILKEMNRKYTAGEYLELIRYARDRIPGIAFTSDIIVGFPGETEQDFDDTLRLVERVGYQSLFTFLYSRRRGTAAAEMDDSTPHEAKTARFARLLELQKSVGIARHRELVGKTVRVLADGPGKTGERYVTGRTETNLVVDFEASPETIGQLVDVRVTEALNWALLGEIAD